MIGLLGAGDAEREEFLGDSLTRCLSCDCLHTVPLEYLKVPK